MHLLNISGYHIIFHYFIEQSDNQLVQQLDKNQYNDAELIELKLALHLPYMNNNSDYARVEGEIEIDGTHYNYVKRKVSNDTLYLLCLPNSVKTKLFEARNNFSAQAADLPASGKQNSIKKIQLLSEYSQTILSYSFSYPTPPAKQVSCRFTPQLVQPYIDHSFQPPESFHA